MLLFYLHYIRCCAPNVAIYINQIRLYCINAIFLQINKLVQFLMLNFVQPNRILFVIFLKMTVKMMVSNRLRQTVSIYSMSCF